ncbi:ubiquitin conjugating enzyme [Niveomyces insectorum RCEF 264]|uniref:Ubiquitin-conjugating enzyme E2 2 n=1 Tax=Niveomyces insectorum RCEF 264 TaxID=1081102 RepID=A0A167RUI7_9HYPO|nr:ubiquitin conjugating enzyme [Niveomyces insectorum RCEF 264]
MSGAKQRLMSEMHSLQKEKWVNIEADDLFRWRIGLMVINPDSDFYGGYFKGEFRFTTEYPYKPPEFRFTPSIFHPNVYPDGHLCISILHNPGDDIMSGEQAGERWSPLQGVESVLLSVLLLLDNPEINSPANVDASVMYRDDRAQYKARALQAVLRSKRDIPPGFVMPTSFDEEPPKKSDNDDAFWAASDDEELDFGSDSDEDDEQDFEDDETKDDDSEDDNTE